MSDKPLTTLPNFGPNIDILNPQELIIKRINKHADNIEFNIALLRIGLNSVPAIDDQLLLIEELLEELFTLRKKKMGVNSL